VNDSAWNLERQDECEPLHFVGCGLDNVFLSSGYDFFDTPEGRGVRIQNLDELHCAIGEYLATHKKTLNGKELRYLRKHMGQTQAELGNLVGLSSQQVARWEKDQCDISGAAESLLRVLYLEYLRKNISVRDLLLKLEERADIAPDRAMFVPNDGGWKPSTRRTSTNATPT
jgi:putative transcriptional regulator